MKFTPEAQRVIVAAVANGCFRYQACAAAGITRKTLREWERLGDQEPGGEHAAFADRLELAQHAAEGRLMMLHHALATGATLPPAIASGLTGTLGDMHQGALLRALQFQLAFGGTRSWAR